MRITRTKKMQNITLIYSRKFHILQNMLRKKCYPILRALQCHKNFMGNIRLYLFGNERYLLGDGRVSLRRITTKNQRKYFCERFQLLFN